ncbi:Beta-galactosidase [Pseudobythopirellula maris]|uniref:Beta-galactosidase n=1 Tax=Pseudobythopirellula maris TaxID=2527991 RepID=A0A5C5ZRM7_9BACT|nr:beta-galactosidase GalB [Pseudobythopirellula maris]TWT90202.1 Beta-galactosidase [Pseudobythopirellula maris]
MLVAILIASACSLGAPASAQPAGEGAKGSARERVSLNEGWRFYKYGSADEADELVYDVRPEVTDRRDDRPADAQPTEAVALHSDRQVLKPWVLPTANRFIADPAQRHERPVGAPGSDFPFVQNGFDDSDWERVTLPHDWAIQGPFLEGWGAEVGGGMGRLPSPGVAWYRRELSLAESDAGKSIFLDVDGAMSYAMVWVNGELVGGWPFGYSSWRLDLTPHLRIGDENQIAIRLDNPPNSSRWYPGGGLYRHVWIVKTDPVHVAQWGTVVTTREVTPDSAIVELRVTIDNDSDSGAEVEATTSVYALDEGGSRSGEAVGEFRTQTARIAPGKHATLDGSIELAQPRLWGPPPTQTPHRYAAVTTLRREGRTIDEYETRFGVRALRFDPERGLSVNGERIEIRGANQHHDLGPLGAAFNRRAAERQLETLREMGCNAIRMSHNPPAPELLELTDRMGFLVINESFDVWERKKTPLDFHLIFPDWSEPDLRALIRRDRNHPSVIMWSVGNEVGEQYTGDAGADVARRLHGIAKQEDPTRPTTTAMNYAKPPMPLPGVHDVISLNYQGEGIRDAPAYRGMKGITTPPLYPSFHESHPDKMIVSSENAAAVSSRGVYMFPVHEGVSAPVKDGAGGDPESRQVSSYELYTTPFGSSADKVLASLEKHPYVAGGFVWSGWDYLGEPTPYYLSRSSYFGVIDLAGFPKDRFYLYQSRWRPNKPMAHILPHWNWPERVGKVTPVHVFTSGDEAELFLNGASMGRKKKGPHESRLRWDDTIYQPGELRVVAYSNGQEWATETVSTTGSPARLEATVDRATIAADGADLAFVTVRVIDDSGRTCPRAANPIRFEIDGPGEIVATANGDPTCMVPFPSPERASFTGLCLAIVRGSHNLPGAIRLTALSDGLEEASISIETARSHSN